MNILLFLKQISPDFLKYTFPLSVDEFIAEADSLFNQQKWGVNLAGKFDSKYEFQIMRKWRIGPIQSSNFYNPTTIKGYVFKNDKAQTQINILVSPHSFVQVLFFILPCFHIFMFFTLESNRKTPEFYILIGTLFIFTPIILLLFAMFLKKDLTGTFVKYFALSQVV